LKKGGYYDFKFYRSKAQDFEEWEEYDDALSFLKAWSTRKSGTTENLLKFPDGKREDISNFLAKHYTLPY
jgi:hypothetical protein